MPAALLRSGPERRWNRSTRSLCRLPPMILGSPTVCRLSLCVTVPCAHRSSTMSSCTEAMVFISATKELSCCRSTFIYQVLIDDCRAHPACRQAFRKGDWARSATRVGHCVTSAPHRNKGGARKPLRHCRAFAARVRGPAEVDRPTASKRSILGERLGCRAR